MRISLNNIQLPFAGCTCQISAENQYLQMAMLPEFGGKITSIYRKDVKYEYLWYFPEMLRRNCSGYDECFSGGIDEVFPNDPPETICGIDFPDHGLLWSTALDYSLETDAVVLTGSWLQGMMRYKKKIMLADDLPHIKIEYKIENLLGHDLPFLWKMHAAVKAEPGDCITCPAAKAECMDVVWSRFYSKAPFDWPYHPAYRADRMPAADGTTEFLLLYKLQEGKLEISRASGRKFAYLFDRAVFPYVCYFASYGGFKGNYFAVAEPATARGSTVNEAHQHTACLVLKPGEVIETSMIIKCE